LRYIEDIKIEDADTNRLDSSRNEEAQICFVDNINEGDQGRIEDINELLPTSTPDSPVDRRIEQEKPVPFIVVPPTPVRKPQVVFPSTREMVGVLLMFTTYICNENTIILCS
jgi:hypothetical protein